MSGRSIFRRFAPLALIVAGLTCAVSVPAADQPSRGEQAVKYRKSLYQALAWNFGPMAAMAQGKAPYNAAEFATRADRVAALAPMLTEAYPPESKGVQNSKLKGSAWTNRADFDAKLKDLIDRSANLAAVAKTGDFEKSKAALFDTGGTCKGCHDKYKSE
jgi:cytochrome c556